jgi:hypothetical protein
LPVVHFVSCHEGWAGSVSAKTFKFMAITAPQNHVEIEAVKSIHCTPTDVFLVRQGDPKAAMQTIDGLKRELMIQKIRYDNVLKGLRYWQARAETQTPPSK